MNVETINNHLYLVILVDSAPYKNFREIYNREGVLQFINNMVRRFRLVVCWRMAGWMPLRCRCYCGEVVSIVEGK